jgi:hypothetical protein
LVVVKGLAVVGFVVDCVTELVVVAVVDFVT